MYKIVKKELLAPNIYLMNIEAPRVARSAGRDSSSSSGWTSTENAFR